MTHDPLGSIDPEAFRAAVQAARHGIAQRLLARRSIIKSHVEFHQAMEPKPGPCGLNFDDVIAKCPVCRQKYDLGAGL